MTFHSIHICTRIIIRSTITPVVSSWYTTLLDDKILTGFVWHFTVFIILYSGFCLQGPNLCRLCEMLWVLRFNSTGTLIPWYQPWKIYMLHTDWKLLCAHVFGLTAYMFEFCTPCPYKVIHTHAYYYKMVAYANRPSCM